MRPEEELEASFYKDIDEIDSEHNIKLVKDIRTGRIYVKKYLPSASFSICSRLKDLKPNGIPHIISIFPNSKQDDGKITVIEEYISGNTLASYLDPNKSVSMENTKRLAVSLCDILAPLHDNSPSLIHRDITPSNIMLRDDGSVVLLDFDATKVYDPERSRDTELMGTPKYAAPEQYGFAQSTPRTDIYAIGIIMRVMRTGSTEPSNDPNLGQLAPVIAKCTEIDPDNRYENVHQLKEAILAIDGETSTQPVALDTETGKEGSVKSESVSGLRSWLPPGFRTGTTWKMILAAIAYAFITFDIVVFNDQNTGMTSVANKIALWITCILWILFFFDYRKIKSRLPLTRSTNPVIKGLGYVLYASLCFLIGGIIYALLEPLLNSLF